MKTKQQHAKIRASRTRYTLREHAQRSERLRLSVFKSNTNIYAQVIDDEAGKTVASASTVAKDLRKAVKNGANMDAAILVGKAIGEKALKAGVKEVYFDRGSYRYHGRVKALADAAREAGLSF